MGKYICKCYSVKESELKELIKEHDIHKYKELKKYSKAGSKDCCKKKIKAML